MSLNNSLYTHLQFIASNDGDEDEDDPEFRYLSTDCGIQPSKRNNYGVPKDVIDMFRVSSNQSSNTLDDIINNRLEDVRFYNRFMHMLFEISSAN